MQAEARQSELKKLIDDYFDRGQFAEAETWLQELLQLSEDKKEALTLLTVCYIESGRAEEAQKAAAEMMKLRGKDMYARFLLARTRFMTGDRAGTIPLLQNALKGKNKQPAYEEKIYNLLGQCWRFLGDSRKSSEAYKMAYASTDDLPLKLLEYSNYLFSLHYREDISYEYYLREHEKYGQLLRNCPQFQHRWARPGKKLRIGYLSPDFRNHVVLRFCSSLLTKFNSEEFEVYAYANCQEDEYSRFLQEKVTGWRNISGLRAEEAARLIYEDEIDILFELAGHTKNNCLPVLAYKPAPVQICGIGYFATTGLKTVDYFLGDSIVDKDAEVLASFGTGQDSPLLAQSDAFKEKLLLLPHSHFCYQPMKEEPLPGTAPCEKKGYVTFGSFNNFTKVTDQVLELWAEIMQAVPGAHLLLKAAVFADEAGRQLIGERLKAQGIDLQRVEMRGFSREYLQDYNDVDIALDTFPYPGGGTTCDALYMGVPVITLAGNNHGGRFGDSLLTNCGLSEFVAADKAAYKNLAAALAGDFKLLTGLRQQLRHLLGNSPVMQAEAYVRAAETVYQGIWELYCSGQKAPLYREISALVPKLKACHAAGDTRQTLAYADYILAAGPENKQLLAALLEVYIDAGEKEAMLTLLPLAAKAQGKDGYYYFLLARGALLLGKMQLAASYAAEALAQPGADGEVQAYCYNLLGRLCRDFGETEKAAAYYLQASQVGTDKRQKCADYSNYLFTLHYLKKSPEFILQETCKYSTVVRQGENVPALPVSGRKKLRIGYISPDLHLHVVALFSMAFFQAYDKSRFEVYAYAACREDFVSWQIRDSIDGWRNITGMTAEAAAELIRQDGIDILVDLAGHTKGNLLPVMALKPAPVQLTGIGYFAPTGLKEIDYFLTDRYTAPAGEEKNFTEKLLRLPETHFCYVPYSPPKPCREAPFKRNGYLTFGSFNNLTKINDKVLAVWAEIMQALPTARLFLKTALLDNAEVKARFIERLQRSGLDLARVRLEGRSAVYLQRYYEVDIALDTFPYPGGGTTCDALYMGVPVITLRGSSHGERFGYSLLKNIGIEECSAASTGEYVEKAVSLAGDGELLALLHQNLRQMMEKSPLMDARRYMAHLEQAYEEIWQEKCQKEGNQQV